MSRKPLNQKRISRILGSRMELVEREAVETFLGCVRTEHREAVLNHLPLNSWHEAAAVIREEYEEFWESVKRDHPDTKELVQIAAMCCRAVVELDPKPEAKACTRS